MTPPKQVTELKIYRNELEAGTLRRTSNGCVFEFNDAFLQSPQFDGISFRIKKNTSARLIVQGTNLPAFFAGLLPEGLRLRALVSQIKSSEDDLFSLFAAAGTQVIGDVYAKNLKTKTTPRNARLVPKLKEIDFYEYLQKILKLNSYTQGEDAIAGVQEKISASMISFPLNIAKETKSYILKLNPKDRPNLVQNELHCMQLAIKCGLNTAQSKLVRDKNKNQGLLVERFDRIYNEKTASFQMIHQEDACQFLSRYPADKYRLSINEIAIAVAELTTAPAVSILKLLQQISFSYLLGNGDLHAKNISLQTTLDGFIDLTPAYDLICTYIYGDLKMALKLNGRDDNLKRKDFLQLAGKFDVPKIAVIKMLDKLVRDFKKSYSVLSKIPMEEKRWMHLEKNILKRLKDLG